MPAKESISANRVVRAVVQRLEDLQRAGVTHVRKPPQVKKPPAHPSSPPPVAQKEPIAKPPLKAPALAANATVSAPPAGPGEDRTAALAVVAQKVAKCVRCAELARTRTQTVFGSGDPHARLVFMGEAPGADEDKQGQPFVGRAGQLLTDIIVKGMKMRREDVYILNTLKCRPPGNRTPLPAEAENCREYLDRQLEIIQPEFICCLGAVAAQNLLGVGTPIGQLRGRFHNYKGIKVVCTYHPAYVLRNPSAKRPVWEDMQMLMAEMGVEIPKQ